MFAHKHLPSCVNLCVTHAYYGRQHYVQKLILKGYCIGIKDVQYCKEDFLLMYMYIHVYMLKLKRKSEMDRQTDRQTNAQLWNRDILHGYAVC